MFYEFIKSVLLIITVFSFFSGLGICMYKAVEYIEDKTYAAKRKIEQIIMTISALHFLLLFRGVNFFLILYSLSIQYIFYSLLDSYPNVQPTNICFIVGTLMALVNHFLILRTMIIGRHYMVEMVFSFVVFVWCTPFCFFLSLSANDDALPVKGKKTNTLIKSFFVRVLQK